VASSAAKRYAQAVFTLAKDQNTLDVWQNDLALLDNIVRDDHVVSYLTNPTITSDKKVDAVESALNTNVQPQTRNLVKLLIERDRAALIPQIREIFDDEVRTERGVAVAIVTTADPLSEAERDLVREKLESMTGKTVELVLRVDPEIIGGIVIRIGDQVIDGSVRNKLERLRARLVSGQR
jgi:F-type H+-transporting ATPase subunit delta